MPTRVPSCARHLSPRPISLAELARIGICGAANTPCGDQVGRIIGLTPRSSTRQQQRPSRRTARRRTRQLRDDGICSLGDDRPLPGTAGSSSCSTGNAAVGVRGAQRANYAGGNAGGCGRSLGDNAAKAQRATERHPQQTPAPSAKLAVRYIAFGRAPLEIVRVFCSAGGVVQENRVAGRALERPPGRSTEGTCLRCHGEP
jgi:hypothetical protein